MSKEVSGIENNKIGEYDSFARNETGHGEGSQHSGMQRGDLQSQPQKRRSKTSTMKRSDK